MAKRIRPTGKSGGNDGIGCGKPPKHTRFKAGQSGNPKGRPTGSRNFETEVRAKLQAPVKVSKNGRERTISTQQPALKCLASRRFKGINVRLSNLSVWLKNIINQPSKSTTPSLGTMKQFWPTSSVG